MKAPSLSNSLAAVIFALFLVALPSSAFCAEPVFMQNRIAIPDGWVLIPQPTVIDCGVGYVYRERLTLRNDSGTIWIWAESMSEGEFAEIRDGKKRAWALDERGDISGIPYLVYSVPPDKSGGRAITLVFPSAGFRFSCAFSTEGRDRFDEFLKWYAPPTGKEFEDYLIRAKNIILGVVQSREKIPDETK